VEDFFWSNTMDTSFNALPASHQVLTGIVSNLKCMRSVLPVDTTWPQWVQRCTVLCEADLRYLEAMNHQARVALEAFAVKKQLRAINPNLAWGKHLVDFASMVGAERLGEYSELQLREFATQYLRNRQESWMYNSLLSILTRGESLASLAVEPTHLQYP
jgi:hypothetical protein